MMMMRWLLGFLVSLVAGHWGTRAFVSRLRDHVDSLRPESQSVTWRSLDLVPGWITGLVERTFFTIAVAFGGPFAIVAMIAWLGAKMATDWNRPQAERQDPAGAFTTLLGGLVSMFFALVGGLICRGPTGP